jgi:hypothetical protein
MNRLVRSFVISAAAGLSLTPASFGQQIRVVTWNTANDVSSTGTDTHPPAIGGPADGVFRALGALSITSAAVARPIDILALQESAPNTGSGANPTAQAYANILNNIYPGANYVAASLNGLIDGTGTGNGPNSLVYRSSTLTLLSQNGVGTVSTTGAARQVLRYQFQPIGSPTSASFYLYDDHFKSGTTTSDNNRRGVEAGIITTDVNTLPANTPIIFAGDYNPTNNTSDLGYHGVITGSATNHGTDPLNPANVTQDWSVSASKSMETESPATSAFFTGQSTGGMHYRDDMLLNSPGMLSGNAIDYITGSYAAFGNTNTHTYLGAITTGSASALAAELSGQYTTAQAATVLTDLAEASDHLPVVADYQLTAIPEPSSLALAAVAAAAVGYIRGRRQSPTEARQQ